MAAAYADEGASYTSSANNGICKGTDYSEVDPKMVSFCAEYRLTGDFLPLFAENYIDYDLLFEMEPSDLNHLFQNEWKLKFIQMKRMQIAISKEKAKKHMTSSPTPSCRKETSHAPPTLDTTQKLQQELNSIKAEKANLQSKISNLSDTIVDLKDELKQSKNATNRMRELYNTQTQKMDSLMIEIATLRSELDAAEKKQDDSNQNKNKSAYINEYDQRQGTADQHVYTWQCGLCSYRNGSNASVCASCGQGQSRRRKDLSNASQRSGSTQNSTSSAARGNSSPEFESFLAQVAARERAREAAVEAARKEKQRLEEKLRVSRESQFVCMCGTKLREIQAGRAYPGNLVIQCDLCGDMQSKLTEVYHCPRVKTAEHPNGFDMCERCAQKKREEFRRERQAKEFVNDMMLLNAILKL